MPLDQNDRLLTISTPLGADEFLLIGFSGREEFSKPFHFQLELISENQAVTAADLVGMPISWKVVLPKETPRQFHGLVRRLTAGPRMSRDHRSYRVEVVPWLWFLCRATDCRIYQNLSVPDILAAVFDRYGFQDFKNSLTGTYAAREYCVQYRETALDFVSRLMEEEGIFYYFTYEDSKHTLVLADAAATYEACSPHSAVEYRPELASSEVISTWERDYAFVSGKTALTDYNFEQPATNLLTTTDSVVQLSGISSFEQFEYPGTHIATARGTALAKLHIEEEEVGYDTANGTSRCTSFRPGGKFTLELHPSDNGDYTFTSIDHSGNDSAIPGISHGSREYSNSFKVIPVATVYRPARRTPRPMAYGPQPAVVVGPSGEEIYTDKYGRVKLQFFWDRIGTKNESSSCWVRVSEAWAGKQWGIIFLPRIGQEVLVEFLNGDPDRPIVTGRVYNADQMPPYALPDNQTQSGVKTRSTKGGDDATFNELRFEDGKDKEDVYFHAQKDFHRFVENDDDLKVEHDQTITIKNNRTLTVTEGNEVIEITKGDRTRTVKTGNDTLMVETGDRTSTVKTGKDTHTVESDHTVTVKTGNDVHTVETGNRTATVKTGNEVLNVDTGNRTVTVKTGNDELTVTSGNHTIKISAGTSTIEAATSITLKVGGNKIEITAGGITISGATVKVAAQTSCSIKGLQTEIAGDAMVKVQGGLIQLN